MMFASRSLAFTSTSGATMCRAAHACILTSLELPPAWPIHTQCCRSWPVRYSVRTFACAGGYAGFKSKLILYSKPGCCLCDGLKEKIDALTERAQFMPSALTDVQLEVRDITTDPAWERAYGLVIPVLTCADADGNNEVKIPRQSPRMSTDRLGTVLEQALAREAA